MKFIKSILGNQVLHKNYVELIGFSQIIFDFWPIPINKYIQFGSLEATNLKQFYQNQKSRFWKYFLVLILFLLSLNFELSKNKRRRRKSQNTQNMPTYKVFSTSVHTFALQIIGQENDRYYSPNHFFVFRGPQFD